MKKAFVSLIQHLFDLYELVKRCRFGIVIAILGGFVFIYCDQGSEVLRALAEKSRQQDLAGGTGVLRLIAFGCGVVAWSLASWYSARVLFYIKDQSKEELHVQPTGRWKKIYDGLPRHLPRVLGVAPMAIIAAGLLFAHGSYEEDPPRLLVILAVLSILGGVVLWVLFVTRRRWLKRRATTENARADLRPESYASVSEMAGGSRKILGAITLATLILLVLFTISPLYFAGNLGTGTVLTLAAAVWVFWGSMLVYWGGSHRMPFLTLVVLWAAVCSFLNDNHVVRTISNGSGFSRDNIETALTKWYARVVEKDGGRDVHPLFIVAAEGGGIRAAYWTASVLGAIQDEEPSFSDHVFAISGVSGGSLGAAVFDGLVANGTTQGEFKERAQTMLGRDFLSPAMAAMLYPDSLQRLLPWPFPFLDRGRWLEQSWEKAWQEVTKTNRFAEPFLDLWKNPEPYVPALFLNATTVESGNRIIASNLAIGREFLGAQDVAEKLHVADIPLSTAAHLSARFTYVSPAGRFQSDGTHVVDGGYFENSGATTALDILREINDVLGREGAKMPGILPKVVMISNSPVGAGHGDRQPSQNRNDQMNLPTIDRETAHFEPGEFLEDALAPPYALLHAREARGVYAERAIGEAQRIFYEKFDPQMARSAGTPVYFFSLAAAKVPLPLGWMLSNRAAEAMQQELYDLGQAKDPNPSPTPRTWNKPMREQIVSLLRGNPPDRAAP